MKYNLLNGFANRQGRFFWSFMKKITKCLIISLTAVLLFSSFNVGKAEENRKVDFSKPMVALTFDDGPRKGTTDEILKILEEENVRATFFVLGEMAAKNPEILRKIYLSGNEIANHTYNHPNLKKISLAEAEKEIRKTDEIIFEITGSTPRLLRAPGGNVTAELKELFLDRRFVLWTVDSLDWKYRSTEHLISFFKTASLKNGDIILMHDIRETTKDALREVIRIIKNRGFEIVTVSELEIFNG